MIDKRFIALLSVTLLLCLAQPVMGQMPLEKEKLAMLNRTEELLDRVESAIVIELKNTEEEIEREASTLVQSATGDAEREAQLKAEEVAMRQKVVNLSRTIDGWATSGKELLKTVSAEELNAAMAEARAIARHYGLNVERLGKLYELGKKTIKENDFVIPGRLPPDEDKSMRRYFESFFIFAEERESELSEYRRKQQEYRLTLFKRVTLAYIRALLASSQAVPPCNQTKASLTIKYDRKSLKNFGCQDPVVEQLRAYVQAVQKIAEADAGVYAAEAEMVVAEQVLVADMSAAIPLVGDAIDFYQLYSGENLAGQCLSRVEYGLTAIFTAIPFLPANWATQVVKRMGLEEQLSNFIMLMAQAGEWTDEMAAGMAARFDITPDMFLEAEKALDALSILLSTKLIEVNGVPKGGKWAQSIALKFGVTEERIAQVSERLARDITIGGAEEMVSETGKITRSAARELNEKLEREAVERAKLVGGKDAGNELLGDIVYKNNLREAFDAQQLLQRLPKEVRSKMEKKSEELLARNLRSIPANAKAAAGDVSEVQELSNLVPAHAEVYQQVAEEADQPIIVRAVNPDSKRVIPANYPTKSMNVKGKSSDWGPQAAFIPVDQNFSKLGNPKGAIDLDEVRSFYKKVEKCVDSGACKKMSLELPDGNKVFIWEGPQGKKPIVQRASDGKYFDHDTGKILDVADSAVTPMEVLAAYDKNGVLKPLTADYDLLAVGSKNPASAAGKWDEVEGRFKIDPDIGYTTPTERDAIDRLEAAIDSRTSYEGGRLVHHGPEGQFVFSPGALSVDPYVTAFDPKKGTLIIPRCNFSCMDKWCRSSGMCGGMPVCQQKRPRPPCLMIDPDRLLKDYFGNLRLRGYTDLRPNTTWKWGDYNGIAGWSPKVVLDVPEGTLKEPGKWAYGQYKMTEGVRVVDAPSVISTAKDKSTYGALTLMGIKATQYLFTCPGQKPPSATGGP